MLSYGSLGDIQTRRGYEYKHAPVGWYIQRCTRMTLCPSAMSDLRLQASTGRIIRYEQVTILTPFLNTNGSNFTSSGLRQKVDQLMDILWSGGVNNPMDSIEQLSYLIFLRLLSEQDDLLAVLDKNYKRVFSGSGRASRGATSSR